MYTTLTGAYFIAMMEIHMENTYMYMYIVYVYTL